MLARPAAGASGAAVVTAADRAIVTGVVIVSYLLGSIPAAVVVARRRGVEIRDVGDRNPGYWNARETLGERAAVPVLLVDALKGTAAAGFGLAAGAAIDDGLWWLPYLCGFSAMVGHAWPLFAGFRGGRCVATFIGAAIAINPVESLGALVVCVVLLAVLRRFSLAARLGVFALPAVQAFADPRAEVACTGAMMTLIGLRFWQAQRAARHRPPAAFGRSNAP